MKIIKRAILCIMAATLAASAFTLAGAAEEAGNGSPAADVPVIMYHRISASNGALGKFVITPTEMESDLKYLRDNGYATVFVADLLLFVNSGVPLPEKPIMLTFDDGYHSDWRYLRPLLEKYDMKAVCSIIGRFTDEYSASSQPINFPHLTWPQITEMTAGGHFEFQSHTYDLHKSTGTRRHKDESEAAYDARVGGDFDRSRQRAEEMLGHSFPALTYPFGIMSRDSEKLARAHGFVCTISCDDGMNHLKQGDTECLYGLKRVGRPHGKGIESVLAALYKSGR